MDKLMEMGRRALFVLRLISGYEERRIRAYRLQLEKQIEQARERRAALRKAPEQLILSEVRKMVEEMQMLNHRLEETEKEIDEYFKPIDKNAEILVNMQLDKEEKNMKEMVKAMQDQAFLGRNTAEHVAKASDLDDGSCQADEVKAAAKHIEETR